MVKITGLDGFGRQLKEAQAALAALDGEIGAVNFNPNDPGSIEAAIQHAESMIDERVSSYASNPIIAPLVSTMKERYREAIIEKAASARLGNVKDDKRN